MNINIEKGLETIKRILSLCRKVSKQEVQHSLMKKYSFDTEDMRNKCEKIFIELSAFNKEYYPKLLSIIQDLKLKVKKHQDHTQLLVKNIHSQFI